MMSGHSSGFYRNPVTRPRRHHPPQVDLQTLHANNEQSGVAVIFWTCFRKAVVSTVGRITVDHDGEFYGFRQPCRQMLGYKPDYFKTDYFHIPSVSSFTNHPIIDFIKYEKPTAA